jgi:hypothetical protein
VYRDVSKRSLSLGGLGSIGDKLAAAIAGFVLVDMFASYCTGREDLKGAIKFADPQSPIRNPFLTGFGPMAVLTVMVRPRLARRSNPTPQPRIRHRSSPRYEPLKDSGQSSLSSGSAWKLVRDRGRTGDRV